jgi:hypothetical protein
MRLSPITKTFGAAATLAAVLFFGMMIGPKAGRADNDKNGAQDEKLMISQGMAISPVQPNMAGKDPDLVGLGSYLVNAVADCNGCHTSDPNGSEWASAYNPYLLLTPKGPFTGTIKVNPATYLAGGQSFGPFISRNLTPDYRGLPEGGHSLSDFLNIIQNGVDLDGIHPTCGAVATPGCVPAPLNGAKLQVMPWAVFRNMSIRQLTAIWTYLSSIPVSTTPRFRGLRMPPMNCATHAVSSSEI